MPCVRAPSVEQKSSPVNGSECDPGHDAALTISDSELKQRIQSNLSHIAIIMDGNGRWAAERSLNRNAGHREGVETVRRVLEESVRLGVRFVTLYAFSSENWSRPKDEVDALMLLFAEYLVKEQATFLKQGIRLIAIGDRSRLPISVRERLGQCEELTRHGGALTLVLAVSYGSRDEVIRATRNIVRDVQEKKIQAEEITESVFSSYLDTRDIPDPDLLIRTSGETRVSNFLLWQIAYSEIVVSPVHWPAFSKSDYRECIFEFFKRERRFGGVEGVRGEKMV